MNKKIITEADKESSDTTINNTNIIPFKKNPEEPDQDWLWYLPIGTVFLAAPPPERDQYGRTVQATGLMEFHVFDKREGRGMARAVKLLTNLNQEQFSWVNSRAFSLAFKKHLELFGPDHNE